MSVLGNIWQGVEDFVYRARTGNVPESEVMSLKAGCERDAIKALGPNPRQEDILRVTGQCRSDIDASLRLSDAHPEQECWVRLPVIGCLSLKKVETIVNVAVLGVGLYVAYKVGAFGWLGKKMKARR